MKRSARIGWIVFLLLSFVVVVPMVVPVLAQAQTLHPLRRDSSPQEPVDGVYRAGRGSALPGLRTCPSLNFRNRPGGGYEGTCVLELVVDAEGMPRDIKVTRAIGMGLDDKALEAVRQWRFKPGMKDGEPVAVRINVETSFHLYGQGNKKPTLSQKANAGDAKAQFEMSQFSGRS